jgi:hypothetical protein
MDRSGSVTVLDPFKPIEVKSALGGPDVDYRRAT